MKNKKVIISISIIAAILLVFGIAFAVIKGKSKDDYDLISRQECFMAKRTHLENLWQLLP